MTRARERILAGIAILSFAVAVAMIALDAKGGVSAGTRAPAEPGVGQVADDFWNQITALEQRLNGAPGDTVALLELARLWHDAHRASEAAEVYTRYLALAPMDRQAWLDLTSVYGELGRWDDALAATDSLLARDSADPDALYNAGAILANLRRTDEAVAWWRAAARQQRNPQVAQLAVESLKRLGVER